MASAMRSPRTSDTCAGSSNITMCPAPGTTTNSASGSASAMSTERSRGVSRSRSPHNTVVRTSRSTGTAADSSCWVRVSKKFAIVRTSVEAMSLSTNLATVGLILAGSPNEPP